MKIGAIDERLRLLLLTLISKADGKISAGNKFSKNLLPTSLHPF